MVSILVLFGGCCLLFFVIVSKGVCTAISKTSLASSKSRGTRKNKTNNKKSLVFHLKLRKDEVGFKIAITQKSSCKHRSISQEDEYEFGGTGNL